jgi:hypothetical protein
MATLMITGGKIGALIGRKRAFAVGYEWFSDSHLGTHYQPDNSDTMTDITANGIGGLAGGVLLVAAAGRRRREDPPA